MKQSWWKCAFCLFHVWMWWRLQAPHRTTHTSCVQLSVLHVLRHLFTQSVSVSSTQQLVRLRQTLCLRHSLRYFHVQIKNAHKKQVDGNTLAVVDVREGKNANCKTVPCVAASLLLLLWTPPLVSLRSVVVWNVKQTELCLLWDALQHGCISSTRFEVEKQICVWAETLSCCFTLNQKSLCLKIRN